jgi:O-antigen/teichoic acid export membrane protein
MASMGQKIVSGAIWTASMSWIGQAANFAIFVVLAHLLGPEAFGLAALAMLPALIFSSPMINAVPDALIQRPEVEPLHLDSFFWFNAAAGTLISALIFLFARPLSALFGQPILVALIHWTSITVAIQSLAVVPNALLLRRLDFRLYAIRNVVGIIAGGILGISMAIGGLGVWSLVGFQITKVVVSTAVLLLTANWRPRLRYSHPHCRELLSFAAPVVGQSFLSMANDELPGAAIGYFLGPQAVGVYTFARRPFSTLWDVFLGPLLTMTVPTIARLRDDPEKINRFFDVAGRLAALISLSVYIGFAAIAPVAVPFIFGSQWTGAILAVQLISLLALVRVIDTLCLWTILGLGHAGLMLKLSAMLTALGIVPVIFAAQFSVEAAILVVLCCYLAMVPVVLVATRRIARVDVLRPLRIVPKGVIAAALMFGAVTFAQGQLGEVQSKALVIAVEIVIGALVYGLIALALMRKDLRVALDTILKLRR